MGSPSFPTRGQLSVFILAYSPLQERHALVTGALHHHHEYALL